MKRTLMLLVSISALCFSSCAERHVSVSDTFYTGTFYTESESLTDTDTYTYTEILSGSVTTDEYIEARVLRVLHFTSSVKAGDKVTLKLSGYKNTRYDIYVYYSKNPANDDALDPKMSDGDGIVTWTWNVPSSVKAGMRKICIIGGGEILTIYLDII